MPLPGPDYIGLARAVARVIVFLQDKRVAVSEPLAYYRLQNLVPIHLKAHFSVGIPWHLIPVQRTLKVISNCSAGMQSLQVSGWRLPLLYHTVWAVSFPRPPSNIYLSFRAPAEMGLVRPADMIPVFWLWIPGQHSPGVVFPSVGQVWRNIFFLAGQTASEFHLFQSSTHCTLQEKAFLVS